jgi:hypothetical protein
VFLRLQQLTYKSNNFSIKIEKILTKSLGQLYKLEKTKQQERFYKLTEHP